MRGYPTDSFMIIGEDGNGKDIGTGMKDGGKADMKDLEEILDTRGLRHPMDLPDLLLEEVTMTTSEIETTALMADNTFYWLQGLGCRAHS